MLGHHDAIATIAVKDLAVARKFYEEVLGLKLEESEGDEAQTYRSGKSRVIVYRSQFAGTNKATALNFVVGDDLGSTVQALKERGVRFERYDMPGMTYEEEIHVAGPMRVAWFKDPDGNIISVMNG